jgi:hypothetical protein
MRDAYKRRPEDFKRRTLTKIYTNRKDLFEEEQKWLNFINPSEIKTRYYNLCLKVKLTWHTSDDEYHKKSIKEKISIKTKEAMNKPEIKNKMERVYEKVRGKEADPVRIEKMKQSMIAKMAKKFPVENRKKRLDKDDPKLLEIYKEKSIEMWANMTDEEKQYRSSKISKSLTGLSKPSIQGIPLSEEHRKKIGDAQRGRKFTEEHKAKLRKPRRKRTEEEKQAQSERIRLSWVKRKLEMIDQ